MNATVIGAAISEDALRAACARSDVPPADVRVIAGRTWVELPHDVRDTVLARLGKELAVTMHVIRVDVSEGGVRATRSTHGGVEDDVSEDARALQARGIGDAQLAWALIDEAEGKAKPAEPRGEQAWAQALLERLVADGSIELTAGATPIDELAQVLQYAGRDVEDWLASRLFEKLMSSSAVDEVFIDANELVAVARQTRPRKR
jgi:hypothetical protein